MTRFGERLDGFDVDEDVCHRGVGVADGVFDIVADAMSFADREFGVDADVNIRIEIGTHFAKSAFFDIDDAMDAEGDEANTFHDFLGWGGIHDFLDGRNEDSPSVEGDDRAGKEGGPFVRGFPAGACKDGDGNANESACGSDGVGAVMPGLGFDGAAAELLGGAGDFVEEGFFDEDDDDEDAEGEECWWVTGGIDFLDTFEGEGDGGTDDGEGHGDGGEGFGFSVAVGVAFVGWFGGDF